MTIATDPVYKEYSFPFIRHEEKEEDPKRYPLLFGGVLESSFQPSAGGGGSYVPKTPFEAYTLELYNLNVPGPLEDARQHAITTLLRSGITFDLDQLREVDNKQFLPSVTSPSSGIPPPSTSTNSYLTPDFQSYLRSLSDSDPGVVCDKIMFFDNFTQLAASDTSRTIDMSDISNILLSPDLEKICGVVKKNTDDLITITAVRTMDNIFKQLRVLNGSPIERYYRFLIFVYLFFDHIPQARAGIDSLLKPIFGMLAGILYQGQWNINGHIKDLLSYRDPDVLDRHLTITLANLVFSGNDVIMNTIKMFVTPYPSVEVAIATLMNPTSGREITQGPIGDLTTVPVTNINPPVNLTLIKRIYDSLGIKDFTFPSRNIDLIPALFGRDEILNAIFRLTAFEVKTKDEYIKLINEVNKLKDQYAKYSANRIGFLDDVDKYLAPSTQERLLGTQLKKISPYFGTGEFTEDPTKIPVTPRKLPYSWAEIMYPALLEYIISPPSILVPAKFVNNLVKLCIQTSDYSIVFPPDLTFDSTASMTVTSNIVDFQIICAIFEFPCPIIDFEKSVWNSSVATFGWNPTPNGAGGNNQRISRGKYTGTSAKFFKYILTDGLNIFDSAVGNGINLTSQFRDIFPYTNEVLTKRTRYWWTSFDLLGARPPPSLLSNIFFPCFDTVGFLNSLFDSKFQVFYIFQLVNYLAGRNDFSSQRQMLLNTISPSMKITKELADSYNAANYVIINNFNQFKNILFSVVGETVISGSLRDIIRSPEFLKNSDLSVESRRVFSNRQQQTPRNVIYDITIIDYITLLEARKVDLSTFSVAKVNASLRQQDITAQISKSKPLLADDYSISLNDMLTRAMF